MYVIGVAEPDPTMSIPDAEAELQYCAYEQTMGGRMVDLGQVLVSTGIWGVNGLRQRILVRVVCVVSIDWPDNSRHALQLYRRYSNTTLANLYDREATQQPLQSLLLAGLPTALLTKAISWGLTWLDPDPKSWNIPSWFVTPLYFLVVALSTDRSVDATSGSNSFLHRLVCCTFEIILKSTYSYKEWGYLVHTRSLTGGSLCRSQTYLQLPPPRHYSVSDLDISPGGLALRRWESSHMLRTMCGACST
jgi:hypothetical protein